MAELIGDEPAVPVLTGHGHNARGGILRLEQLAESTTDAIIVIDRDTRVMAWNYGAQHAYGWAELEVVGQELPCIVWDRRKAARKVWRRVLELGKTVENYVDLRLSKDGRRLHSLATVSPLRDESRAIVGALIIARDVSALKALEEQRAAQARLDERETIAMDLHDNVIQALHGAVLALTAAERIPDEEVEQLRSVVGEIRHQLNDTVKDLRAYLLQLRPHDPGEPRLLSGLAIIGAQARLNAQLEVAMDIDPTAETSVGQADVRRQLLAIAREATSNVIRHAHAHRMAIRLSKHDGRLILAIWDDGRGFDATADGYGNGLRNMHERARRVGGRLVVDSSPDSGTVVQVQLQTHMLTRPD